MARDRTNNGYPGVISPRAALSERELSMLVGLAQGLTNKAIASAHGISSHTVDNYVRRVFTKLEVNNRSSAVAVGMREGLI